MVELNHLLRRALLAAAIASVTACGHSSQTVALSAVSADPSSYDQQDITVSGTAKDAVTRQTRRGTATRYQLCDTACINVIAFGASGVADGSKQTVTGRFHTSFGRRRVLSNVLVVGGRPQPQGSGP
ncbi:MAG TPA: hypothetical protein VHS56_04390 [Candidatus Cybelea sp.]|jgi:hypothetical protein|nr:hypothetical protein [Candidatus Cybelea sp.]